METKTYKANERIFLEGDEGDVAYLIQEGEVELVKTTGEELYQLDTLGAGQMIGEMALIDKSPRSATAKCLRETRVMVIPQVDFEKRLSLSDPVIRRMLSMLIKRLRQQTTTTTENLWSRRKGDS